MKDVKIFEQMWVKLWGVREISHCHITYWLTEITERYKMKITVEVKQVFNSAF